MWNHWDWAMLYSVLLYYIEYAALLFKTMRNKYGRLARLCKGIIVKKIYFFLNMMLF